MSKIPYFEYFQRDVNGVATPWLNLSYANASNYFTNGIQIGTWGERVGIISSCTGTVAVSMQYSHDNKTWFSPIVTTPSNYTTVTGSLTGSKWTDLSLGAASWIRLQVIPAGVSGASTFILNRVEEH